MSRLSLFVLGAPRIELNDARVEIRRRKAIALLSYLAITAKAHTRDHLATLFWPERDQARAYAYLRQALWELNKALGEGWLETSRELVELRGDAELWVDALHFNDLITGHDPNDASDDCLKDLAEAVHLYRGDFLSGFTLRDSPDFDEWQFFNGEALRQQLARVLEKLGRTYGERGEYELAVSYGRQWLSLDPLHEPAHRHLMVLYAQMGQRSAALRQYETCAHILDEELGLTPQPESTALYEQIRTGKQPIAELETYDGSAVALRQGPIPEPFYDMPLQLTPFVGRRGELTEIGRLLEDNRLLTLVGPGGSGKTRLAIQAATNRMSSFSEGIWFVPLASVTSSHDIVPAMAKALRFSFYDGEERIEPREQLLDYLRQKKLLLVLDNFEQLIEATGPGLLTEILYTARDVKMLVTSRARLNMVGESLFPVKGLNTPSIESASAWETPEDVAQYSAVLLFIQTVRQVQPALEMSTEDLASVVRICRQVDGMPLGIELAASWMAILTPAEIEAEIERSFDFLETDLRDVPARQRSLRVVFNSSWSLLSIEERSVFQRLSLFVDSFDRDAAKQVTGASLRTLIGLVNKSMIHRRSDGRFAIHDLLRQYGLEQLQSDSEIWKRARDRHSAYFATFVYDRGEMMKGPEQKAALDAVEVDIENARASWFWAINQGQYSSIDMTLNGFYIFYTTRGLLAEFDTLLIYALTTMEEAGPGDYDALLYVKLLASHCWFFSTAEFASVERKDLIRRTLARAQELVSTADLGFEYGVLSCIYAWTVEIDEGIELLRESVAILREGEDSWSLALSLFWLGELLSRIGEREEAKRLLEESIALSRQRGDRLNLARILEAQSAIAAEEQEYDRAIRLCEECQEIYETLSARDNSAFTLKTMGENSMRAGEYKQAINIFERAQELFTETGNRGMTAYMMSMNSLAAHKLGDTHRAKSSRQDSLALFKEIGDRNGVAWSYWEMGEIARVERDYRLAGEWYEKSRALYQELQDISFLYHRGSGDIALAKGDYVEAQRRFGECLTQAQVYYRFGNVSYALSGLGRASVGLRDFKNALHFFLDAMQKAQDVGDRGLLMIALAGVAGLMAATKKDALAIELAGFVLNHQASWWETKELAREVVEDAAGELPPDVVAQAQKKAAMRELDELVKEVMISL